MNFVIQIAIEVTPGHAAKISVINEDGAVLFARLAWHTPLLERNPLLMKRAIALAISAAEEALIAGFKNILKE